MNRVPEIFLSEVFGELRIIEENNKFYFCAVDVCKALGYTNITRELNIHCRQDGIKSGRVEVGGIPRIVMKNPDPKELFIILSYYSNEDDGEFDRVGSCDKVYSTLEAAKAAADKLFKEDKENRPENIALAYTLDDCVRDIEENPLYVVGEWQKNAFGSYHNFYAVFGVSLTED